MRLFIIEVSGFWANKLTIEATGTPIKLHAA